LPRFARQSRKLFRSGGAGRKKGCGENEFPPRPRFSAAAIFRASETGAPSFVLLISL